MKIIYKFLMTFLLLWQLSIITHGQVTNYIFSQSVGTFTPITGGTLVSSSFDDNVFAVTLPTSFTFNGTSSTSVTFAANGFLALGTTTFSNSTIPISSSGIANGVVSALGMDLISNGTLAELRWEQIGNEIIFQWLNVKRYNSTAFTDENFSFQIRLNTSSGKISIIYNGSSMINVSTSKVPQVGLRGSTNSSFNARNLSSIVPDSSPAWNDTAPATVNSDVVRFTSTSPSSYPDAGRTFEWTFINCNMPTAVTSSNITTTTATINWTAPASAPSSGYQYYYSTTNTPPSGSTIPSGSTAAGITTVNLSGLTSSTNYLVWVRSNCGGTDISAWSVMHSFFTVCSTSNVPYALNFEAVTVPALPACTSVQNAGTGNLWKTINTTFGASSSNVLVYEYNTSNPANTWFYTNGLNLVAGQSYVLNYDYASESTGTYVEKMKVAYGTSSTNTSMTNILADHTNIITGDINIAHNKIVFSPITSGVYYLGFQCYSAIDQFNLYVDNISIEADQAMDYVNMQFPANATTNATVSIPVYTQGYELGVTEPSGAGAGINVWVGVSSTNTDPSTWPTNSWVVATFNGAASSGNNDEYVANIGSNNPPGTYYYASRWQLNNGSYRYGGFPATGSANGFWDGVNDMSGVLTIIASKVNDDCSGAINLTSTPGAFDDPGSQNFSLSTASPNIASCGINLNEDQLDVWYAITTDNDGINGELLSITIDPGLLSDLALVLYTGTCGTLTEVECIDDNLDGESETITISEALIGSEVQVRENTKYFLRVIDYYGDDESFTISAQGSTALPIQLLSFNVRAIENNQIGLDWTLSDELKLKDFTVERSADNINWKVLNIQNGSGKLKYNYVDINPIKGNNFYRIAIKEKNNSISYSKVKSISLNKNGSIALYPNPAIKSIFLVGENEPNATISFYNEMGILVKSMNHVNIDSSGTEILVDGLISGAYIVKISGQNDIKTLRFIKG